MKILILGYGNTGKSIQKYLDRKEIYTYKIWDDYAKDVPANKVENQIGNIDRKNYDLIYTSPGIKPNHIVFRHLHENKLDLQIKTDLDIFFEEYSEKAMPKIIGITGTNGKSTCVEILRDIISKSGAKVDICGNVGIPILDYSNTQTGRDYLILELSSFQLHYVNTMILDIAGIVNISEDHIDWHEDKDEYQKIKLTIGNYLINKNKTFLGTVPPGLIDDMNMDQYVIIDKAEKEKNNISKDIQNIIFGICDELNIDSTLIDDVLSKDRVNEHKFQIFGKDENYTFINDSKATNFSSVSQGLKKVKRGLLVMHGDFKGVDKKYLNIHEGIHTVVFYGEAFVDYNFGEKNIYNISKFDELPKIIDLVCTKGDTIILSPGGSSFEHFDNYQDRGFGFMKVVNERYLLKT